MTNEQLLAIVGDTNNASARKFHAMGFKMLELECCPSPFGIEPDGRTHYVRGMFQCACGKVERFAQSVYDDCADHANAYRMLDVFGSMSRNHLLADGYPPGVVDDMIRKGEAAAMSVTQGDWALAYDRVLDRA